MDVGTLTGEITLDDQMSAALARVNTLLDRFGTNADVAMRKAQSSMTMAAGVGSFLGTTLAHMGMQALAWGKNLVTSSLMAGARLEQLGVATRFLGEKAGYSNQYIDDLAKAIQKTGISGISTRESILQLLGANIDLTNAAKLSAIAQNMQSLSGRSSSEVFQVMTRAIATGNTEILRNIGFQNVSIETLKRANRGVEGFGKTLTGAQRSTLIMNAIMAEGAEKAGLYGQSMTTAGKQASSAERAWAEVSEQIGTILLPITSVAIKSWYALGSAVRDSVMDAQGAVAGSMKTIASALQAVITKSSELASVALPAIISGASLAASAVVKYRIAFEAATVALGTYLAVSALVKAWLIAQPVLMGIGTAALYVQAFGWEAVALGIQLTLGPIGLVTIALTALYAAFRLMPKSAEEMDRAVKASHVGIVQWGNAIQETGKKAVVAASELEGLSGSAATVYARISGLRLAKEVDDLTMAFNRLTDKGPPTRQQFIDITKEAMNLKTQGANVGFALEHLISVWEKVPSAAAPVVKAQTEMTDAALAHAKKLQTLSDKLSGRDILQQARDYEVTLRKIGGASRLSSGELDDYVKVIDEVIEKYRVVGSIEGAKVVQHYKTLSLTMREVYNQYQATRQVILAQDRAMLESKGVSLAYIESQKELGLSETAIAIQYGVSTDALQKYSVAMQAFQTLVDAVTEAERKRAEEAFQNSAEVANTYSESYKKASDAVIEFQARMDALKQTGSQQRDAAMQLEIIGLGAPAAGVESMHAAAVARIREFYALLRVDTQALTTQSQASLQAVADAAERTYQAALANAQEYGAGAMKVFRDSAQAARDALSGLDVDWSALRSNSIESLQAIADRAVRTYQFAIEHAQEFSREQIKAFRDGARAAQEAVRGIDKNWKALTDSLRQSASQLSNLTVGNLGSLLFGFGSDSSGELKRAAQEAHQVYLEIQRRGRSTAEELTLAFQRWREAEDRANNTFGERFGQLWRNMKSVFVSILDSMLEYFTKRFLVGVIEGIAGAKLGQKLGAALGSSGGSGGGGGGFSNVASNVSLGQRVAGWFGLGGGGAAAGSGAGLYAGTTLAGGAASLPIAPATGGAGSALGLGGMSLSTGLWTAGIGTAAALLYWGIKNKGLFRGGAEHFINKRRDQFQLQLGGPPVSKGGSVMAAKLASWGSGFLFDMMQRARKKNQYDTAQSAIVASFAAHGQQIKSYEHGGFTPPHTTELALVHGGQRGEAHIPGGMLGNTVNQYITIEGGVLDAGTVTKIFREHLIRLLKEALKLNTSGLREATAEVVG